MQIANAETVANGYIAKPDSLTKTTGEGREEYMVVYVFVCVCVCV